MPYCAGSRACRTAPTIEETKEKEKKNQGEEKKRALVQRAKKQAEQRVLHGQGERRTTGKRKGEELWKKKTWGR